MKKEKTLQEKLNILLSNMQVDDLADTELTGPNVKSCLNNTPLHVAAVRGDIEAIEILLEAGADINAVGEGGYTPLHEAIAQGHVEAVRTFIAHRAAIDIDNEDGSSPYDFAIMWYNAENIPQREEILKMLEKAQAERK